MGIVMHDDDVDVDDVDADDDALRISSPMLMRLVSLPSIP